MPWTPTMPPSLPPVPRRGRRRRGRGGSSLKLLFLVLVQFLGKVVVPVLCNDTAVVRQCRKPCWRRSCSSSKVDGLPSCCRGKSPWSCLFNTIQTPQLQSVRWSMPPCHARCRSDRCSWFRHCRKLWRCVFVCFRIHCIAWFAVDTCVASVTEAV